MHEETLFWLKTRLPERRWPDAERALMRPHGPRAMQLALADALHRVIAPLALEHEGHPAAAVVREAARVRAPDDARVAAAAFERAIRAQPSPYGIGAVSRALLDAAEGYMGLSSPAPFGLACLRIARLSDDIARALEHAIQEALERWLDEAA